MNGEPLPYLLRADWLITALLFLCLVLVSYVLSHGKKHLLQQIKGLFTNRERASLFDDATASDMRYTFLLISHTCVMLGCCLYNYYAQVEPQLFGVLRHSLLLGLYTACVAGLVLVKWLAYTVVNWVFFDKERNAAWTDFYFNVVMWTGFLLLPIVLLFVYFDLPLSTSLYLVAFVIIFAKITLFFRCFSNFFNNLHGCLHLFLYFCTLEILPDLLVWKSIGMINQIILQ